MHQRGLSANFLGCSIQLGTNQSGVPEWGTRKKLPSTRTTRTGGPKRRGFRKGDSDPHSCTADLPHHGPIGCARLGRGSDYHGLFEMCASFSGLDGQDDPVLLFRLKDEDLLEAPDDSAFLQSLRFSCARVNGVYPPLARALCQGQPKWWRAGRGTLSEMRVNSVTCIKEEDKIGCSVPRPKWRRAGESMSSVHQGGSKPGPT